MWFKPVILWGYDDDNLFPDLRNAMVLAKGRFLAAFRRKLIEVRLVHRLTLLKNGELTLAILYGTSRGLFLHSDTPYRPRKNKYDDEKECGERILAYLLHALLLLSGHRSSIASVYRSLSCTIFMNTS